MKQIKKKPIEHSIAAEKVASKVQKAPEPFFDYMDTFTFKMKPMSIEGIERIAAELVNWARNNDDALKIAQFWNDKGINHQDFYRWMEWSPALKSAHEITMSILGTRREIGAIQKKFDTGMISFTMPFYDKNWKDNVEWRSSLKAKEAAEQNNETKIVIMERIPDSPLVPSKPKKEEPKLTPEDVAKKLARHPEMKYRKSRYD